MNQFGIIFDCDGTLVDSLGNALKSFNYALDRVGAPPRTPESLKKYFGAAADRILLQILRDESLALQAFDFFLDHQTELAKTTKLHDGILSLLESLKSDGVAMGIVTGRHARDMEIVLKPHCLAEYFVALVADSHLPKSKPAPDGILMAAEKMGLPASRTLYVGDSVTDLQAAHAAGSIPVAALWDRLVKPEEMLREKPAFMAQTPGDVLRFFREQF